MGRKFVLLDDYDGKELPDETSPVRLSLGRTTYSLYLSEANHGKLLEALNPFLEGAETTDTHVSAVRASRAASPSTAKADKERLKAIREWAIENRIEYKNAQGETKTLGERGRIPSEVIEAYDAAH